MTKVEPPPLPLLFSITVTGILASTLVGPAIPDVRRRLCPRTPAR